MNAIELINMPAQAAVYIRTRTGCEHLSELIGKSYMKIIGYLNEKGVQPASVPYTAYYNLDMQDLDVEMGFPVAQLTDGKEEILSREIPVGMFLVYMYKGPYCGMEKPYNEIYKWMAEKGYEQNGPCYEYYYNSPQEVPESELLTRIVLPVKEK